MEKIPVESTEEEHIQTVTNDQNVEPEIVESVKDALTEPEVSNIVEEIKEQEKYVKEEQPESNIEEPTSENTQ